MVPSKIDRTICAAGCDRQTSNLSILDLIGCLLELNSYRVLMHYFKSKDDSTWFKSAIVTEPPSLALMGLEAPATPDL